MKELRNSFDHEVSFSNLQKAKEYYGSGCVDDGYLNALYCSEIESARSLEDLAEVLNRWSDVLNNGTRYFVKYF